MSKSLYFESEKANQIVLSLVFVLFVPKRNKKIQFLFQAARDARFETMDHKISVGLESTCCIIYSSSIWSKLARYDSICIVIFLKIKTKSITLARTLHDSGPKLLLWLVHNRNIWELVYDSKKMIFLFISNNAPPWLEDRFKCIAIDRQSKRLFTLAYQPKDKQH